MFRKIDDFVNAWIENSNGTRKLFGALADGSLGQSVADGHRKLGQIAWHITMTIPEMCGRMGLDFDGFDHQALPPDSAREICDTYDRLASKLAEEVKSRWTDADLEIEDDMYGMQWKRGFSLAGLLAHEAHHRGQMTVLMRQAGLEVPGVFGPSKNEWGQFGMEAPAY